MGGWDYFCGHNRLQLQTNFNTSYILKTQSMKQIQGLLVKKGITSLGASYTQMEPQ